ncbi:MAG: Holliday junction resolvase RuvX [Anaerolineae bacterium]|nr:Holliday junction resolvase RuvX [Anaerolineae bacterium]
MPPRETLPPGPFLALDVGERRIGVAYSDPTGTLATPWMTVVRASRREDFATVARLAGERRAVAVIVGHPLNMNGSEGLQARRVARYAQALAEHLVVPVLLWDERLSTDVALERRQIAGRSPSRASVDAEAAAIILQDYLDARRANTGKET